MLTMYTIQLYLIDMTAKIRSYSDKKINDLITQANAGDGQAQYELYIYVTIMKAEGKNIKNIDAGELLRKSIANGYPFALLLLGLSYSEIDKVDDSGSEFHKAYKLGCDLAIEGWAMQAFIHSCSSKKLDELEFALELFEKGAQKGLFGSMILYGWLLTFSDMPKQILTKEKKEKAALFADMASNKLPNILSEHYSIQAYSLLMECELCLGRTYEFLAQNQSFFQKREKREYYSKAYDAYKRGSYLNAAYLILKGKVNATKADALILIKKATLFPEPWIPEQIKSSLTVLIKSELEYQEAQEDLVSFAISESLNVAIGNAFDKINLSNKSVDAISRELASQIGEQLSNLTAHQILTFAKKWKLF